MTTTQQPTTAIHTTGHVGLNVTDIGRSIAFYAEVLGLGVSGSGDDGDHRWAFLTGGGRLVLTLWQQASGPFTPTAAGLHHLSFEVPSIGDVRAAEARLRAADAVFAYDGIVPHRESATSGGIFFHDPDGTRLEIYTADGGAEGSAPNGAAPTCGFF